MSTVFQPTAYHHELIEGEEIEKPLPKELHAIVQSYLLIALAQCVSRRLYRVLPELNVVCGRDRLVPDLTVVSRTASYLNGDLVDAPVLCVEILSPGQTLSNIFDKAERLIAAGTTTCWVIWPEQRQAWIYQESELHEAAENLTAEIPSAATVKIELREMWAELD